MREREFSWRGEPSRRIMEEERETMQRLLAAAGIALLLAGCQVKPPDMVRHDENRAAAEAAEVLGLVYIVRDYERAAARLHPDARVTGPAKFDGLVTGIEARRGGVQELERDSFLPSPGERTMTVFFRATHERGSAYHRVTVLGDAGGYQVAELSVQGDPYPAEPARQAFRTLR
jgi:hypothetical protein